MKWGRLDMEEEGEVGGVSDEREENVSAGIEWLDEVK